MKLRLPITNLVKSLLWKSPDLQRKSDCKEANGKGVRFSGLPRFQAILRRIIPFCCICSLLFGSFGIPANAMLETAIYEVAYVPLEAIFIGIASAIGYDISKQYTAEQMYQDLLEYDSDGITPIIKQSHLYYGDVGNPTTSETDSTTVTYVAPVYVESPKNGGGNGGNGGNGNKNTRIDKWLSAAVTSVLIDKLQKLKESASVEVVPNLALPSFGAPLTSFFDVFLEYFPTDFPYWFTNPTWTRGDFDTGTFIGSLSRIQSRFRDELANSPYFDGDETNYCVVLQMKSYKHEQGSFTLEGSFLFDPMLKSRSGSLISFSYSKRISFTYKTDTDGFIDDLSNLGFSNRSGSLSTYCKVTDGLLVVGYPYADYDSSYFTIYGGLSSSEFLLPKAGSSPIDIDLDIDDPNQPAVIDEWLDTRSAIQVIKDDIPQIVDSISLGFGSTLPIISDLVSGQTNIYDALGNLSQVVSTTGQTFIDSITPWISLADTITTVTSDFLSEGIFGNIWHYVLAFFGTAHNALSYVRYIIFEKNPNLSLLFFAPMAIATVFGILHKLL